MTALDKMVILLENDFLDNEIQEDLRPTDNALEAMNIFYKRWKMTSFCDKLI